MQGVQQRLFCIAKGGHYLLSFSQATAWHTHVAEIGQQGPVGCWDGHSGSMLGLIGLLGLLTCWLMQLHVVAVAGSACVQPRLSRPSGEREGVEVKSFGAAASSEVWVCCKYKCFSSRISYLHIFQPLILLH